jgi:N4-gp56 family major capsid protein
MQAIDPSIINPGIKSSADPLGQRGYVGWKSWWSAVILNELWMARLEVGASVL